VYQVQSGSSHDFAEWLPLQQVCPPTIVDQQEYEEWSADECSYHTHA
jgi:hypothetical protein